MNKPLANILKFDKTLDIRNVDQLPHGTGAKYPEVARLSDMYDKKRV